MKRRQFLKNSLYASAGAAFGTGMTFPFGAYGMECSLPDMPRTLVNLMFYGGIDSRFVFASSCPHPITTR
jgi:hypothetical protein